MPHSPTRLRRAQNRPWARLHGELARLTDNSEHVTALRSDHDVASSRDGQPSVVISAVQAVVHAGRRAVLTDLSRRGRSLQQLDTPMLHRRSAFDLGLNSARVELRRGR